jgi:hypothetical protein
VGVSFEPLWCWELLADMYIFLCGWLFADMCIFLWCVRPALGLYAGAPVGPVVTPALGLGPAVGGVWANASEVQPRSSATIARLFTVVMLTSNALAALPLTVHMRTPA